MSFATSLHMDLSRLEIKERQRRALETLRPFIEEVLEPRDVVPQLLARRAILSGDRGSIYAQRDRASRVRKLVEVLPKRDPWFGPLVDSLIRSGHGNIAERLLVQSSNSNSAATSMSSAYSHASSSPRDVSM